MAETMPVLFEKPGEETVDLPLGTCWYHRLVCGNDHGDCVHYGRLRIVVSAEHGGLVLEELDIARSTSWADSKVEWQIEHEQRPLPRVWRNKRYVLGEGEHALTATQFAVIYAELLADLVKWQGG